jgi:transcription elongation factor GreA
MIKLTPLSKKRLEANILNLEKQLQVAVSRLADAVGFGDLSENSEHDSAKAAVGSISSRKQKLEDRLLNSVVVEPFYDGIHEGSLILVQDLDKPDLPPRMMLFDSIGTSTLNGVLHVDSPLGKAVYNQSPGKFSFFTADGRKNYMVTLLPESKLEEFENLYPSDESQMLDKLFAEVGIDE